MRVARHLLPTGQPDCYWPMRYSAARSAAIRTCVQADVGADGLHAFLPEVRDGL